MKKEKNELFYFFGGLAMLAVGLYLFSSKVIVSTGFFGGMGLFGVSWLNSGLVVVPFIIGVVMMFAMENSFPGKVVAVLGILVIIAAVIQSTTIRLTAVTLYEWILYLFLIFGGMALVARVLFKKDGDGSSKGRGRSGDYSADDELERLKKNMK